MRHPSRNFSTLEWSRSTQEYESNRGVNSFWVGSLNSYYLGQHFDGAYNKQNKYNNALKPSNVLSKYHFYRTDTNWSIIFVFFNTKYKPKLDLASINWIFPGSNFLGLCILEIPNWIFPSPVGGCISSVSTCYNNIKLFDLLCQK